MPILLYRVDERLVHGQVVLGWGGDLRPQRYLVVDDDLAASEWEQDLYRLSLPDDVELEFASLASIRASLSDVRSDARRTILLTRDAATMSAVVEAGDFDDVEINLGGIHHRDGRREVASYLFLDDDDRAAVRRMSEAGANVSGRDLPGAPRVDLTQLLR